MHTFSDKAAKWRIFHVMFHYLHIFIISLFKIVIHYLLVPSNCQARKYTHNLWVFWQQISRQRMFCIFIYKQTHCIFLEWKKILRWFSFQTTFVLNSSLALSNIHNDLLGNFSFQKGHFKLNHNRCKFLIFFLTQPTYIPSFFFSISKISHTSQATILLLCEMW